MMLPDPSALSPQQQLKQTRLLFTAILSGVLIFLLVAVVVNETMGVLKPSLLVYLTEARLVIAIVSFTAMLTAKRLFTRDMETAKKSLIHLSDKLNHYRSALIKYVAICEVPAMVAIILFLFMGNFIFIVYAAVLIGFIAVMMPSRKKIITLLDLDSGEQLELEK